MVDITLLQSISYMAAAVSLFVGAVYYIMNLRFAAQTRQAQLFMQLYDRFHDTVFWKQYADIIFKTDWKDMNDFWNKYGPENTEAFAEWMSFGTYFTGIGVMLKRRMINVGVVNDLIGDYVIWVWDKWKTLLDTYQKKPQSIIWFEYLYDEITKERKRLGRSIK
jgi:hypothetical protein